MEGTPPQRDDAARRCRRVRMDLPVAGGHLCLEAAIPAGRCDLASIVPAARTIASRLASLTVSILRRHAIDVPCRKGCSTCCHYLVPLTVSEAMALRRAVEQLQPDRRDAIHARMAAWSAASDLPSSYHPRQDAPGTFARLADRYARNQTACPLLHAGLCTMYDARPIACREHSAMGPASRCHHSRGGTPTPVITSVFEALGRLHSELTGQPMEVIPMPSLHTWWQLHSDDESPAGDGETMIRRLGTILAEQFNTFVTSRRAG